MPQISDYLYRKASANKIPLGASFELSPVCNFACKMCYLRKTAAQVKAEGKRIRDWTEWLALAEACRKEGTLYLLLTGDYTSADIVPLVRDCFRFIRDYRGEVPGASAKDCGNYLDMNLPMANYWGKKYAALLENPVDENLTYPE